MTAPRPAWDRGDGYDANDPDAPDALHCSGCDAIRSTMREFCTGCRCVTDSYVVEAIPGFHAAAIERFDADHGVVF